MLSHTINLIARITWSIVNGVSSIFHRKNTQDTNIINDTIKIKMPLTVDYNNDINIEKSVIKQKQRYVTRGMMIYCIDCSYMDSDGIIKPLYARGIGYIKIASGVYIKCPCNEY